jgi:hypothetical protein
VTVEEKIEVAVIMFVIEYVVNNSVSKCEN